jgi:hypothetical protein
MQTDNGIDNRSFVTSAYDKSFHFRNIAIQDLPDALNLLKQPPGLDGLIVKAIGN